MEGLGPSSGRLGAVIWQAWGRSKESCHKAGFGPAGATTATAAHSAFRSDASGLFMGTATSCAYNIALSLLSHTFSCDLPRGAGSTRAWVAAGAIYGTSMSMGIAHLAVRGDIDLSGVTPSMKDSLMKVFTALTKRSICEIGSCCQDLIDFIDAIRQA